jgi:hypothetical protein
MASEDGGHRRFRLELKQAVELALEFARVRLDGGIGEIGPPAADVGGVLQELFEGRGEHGIAGIDGATSASRIRWARQNWCASA